jgi:hypothetical protein
MEKKLRGPNGTIYLSDGFVDLALISNESLGYDIRHFGFVVDSVEAIESSADTKANANTPGAVAESWVTNRVDVAGVSWPV